MYCGYESTCINLLCEIGRPNNLSLCFWGISGSNVWRKQWNTKLTAQAQRAKWDSQPIVRNGSIGHCINKNTHSPIPEIKMKINNVNLISAWSNTSTPVCSFAGIHFSQGPEFQNLHKHKLDKKKQKRASGMAGKFFSISLDNSSYQGKVVKSWEVHLGGHSKLTLIQTIHTCSHWITDTRYLCIKFPSFQMDGFEVSF